MEENTKIPDDLLESVTGGMTNDDLRMRFSAKCFAPDCNWSGNARAVLRVDGNNELTRLSCPRCGSKEYIYVFNKPS